MPPFAAPANVSLSSDKKLNDHGLIVLCVGLRLESSFPATKITTLG